MLVHSVATNLVFLRQWRPGVGARNWALCLAHGAVFQHPRHRWNCFLHSVAGNNPDWDISKITRRQHIFLKELEYAMVTPHMKQRAWQRFITHTIQAAIRAALKNCGVDVQPRQPHSASISNSSKAKRRRCSLCQRRNNKKAARECTSCNRPVCGEHSRQQAVCDSCY